MERIALPFCAVVPHYKLQGSHWYMDGGPQEVSFGAKCLLTWPGLDRCGSVGFGWVVDSKL